MMMWLLACFRLTAEWWSTETGGGYTTPALMPEWRCSFLPPSKPFNKKNIEAGPEIKSVALDFLSHQQFIAFIFFPFSTFFDILHMRTMGHPVIPSTRNHYEIET